MNITIDQIVNDIHEYQKKNGTVGQCLTNVQTLYDIVNDSGVGSGIKARSYISVGVQSDGKIKIIKKHMVLVTVIDGETKIIDPSYDVASLSNLKYFETYGEYKTYGEYNNQGYPLFEKDDIRGLIKFIEISGNINNGVFCTAEDLDLDLDLYHSQLDYIMGKYNERKDKEDKEDKDKEKNHWCEHEDCLEEVDYFTTQKELEEHSCKCHGE